MYTELRTLALTYCRVSSYCIASQSTKPCVEIPSPLLELCSSSTAGRLNYTGAT